MQEDDGVTFIVITGGVIAGTFVVNAVLSYLQRREAMASAIRLQAAGVALLAWVIAINAALTLGIR